MTFEEIRALFKDYTAVDDDRQRLIYNLVLKTRHLKGHMLEVGVYRGGTSFLIANADLNRHLFSIDTFEGLPAPTPGIDTHEQGDFKDTSFEGVKSLLAGLNVTVLKGLFPNDYCKWLGTDKFSFVHLDVDLYQATLDSLCAVYPSMIPGGILVSDDYNMRSCPGVKKAFDEFMKDKPETLIDSGVLSCYFIKL